MSDLFCKMAQSWRQSVLISTRVTQIFWPVQLYQLIDSARNSLHFSRRQFSYHIYDLVQIHTRAHRSISSHVNYEAMPSQRSSIKNKIFTNRGFNNRYVYCYRVLFFHDTLSQIKKSNDYIFIPCLWQICPLWRMDSDLHKMKMEKNNFIFLKHEMRKKLATEKAPVYLIFRLLQLLLLPNKGYSALVFRIFFTVFFTGSFIMNSTIHRLPNHIFLGYIHIAAAVLSKICFGDDSIVITSCIWLSRHS